ncbi:GxxExxY protein [Acidisphaera sp. S103]|uniref:GxxExxY protein n=1 Tax=Acidisphaera sp. S103 TaxID=1747223 RepID=UPI001C20B3BE|nr:GxxExxY protein [Acidisphaera sp. S103]
MKHQLETFARPSGVGTDAKVGLLRRISGMKVDEGDLRFWVPVTERIIRCAFRVANALGHGFVEKVSEMPLLMRCESVGSASCSIGGPSPFTTT